MDQKILLIVLAVLVLLLPQIISYSRYLVNMVKNKINKPIIAAKPAQQINTEPANWINDLYTLQQVLIIHNRSEAAELLGQAMVKIIDSPSTKVGGSKR